MACYTFNLLILFGFPETEKKKKNLYINFCPLVITTCYNIFLFFKNFSFWLSALGELDEGTVIEITTRKLAPGWQLFGEYDETTRGTSVQKRDWRIRGRLYIHIYIQLYIHKMPTRPMWMHYHYYYYYYYMYDSCPGDTPS